MTGRQARRIERQVRRDLIRPEVAKVSRRTLREEVVREGQRAYGRRMRSGLSALRAPSVVRAAPALASVWLVIVLVCSPAFVGQRMLIAASGGELLVDVGSFTKINTVTTQAVSLTAGKTWVPKAILFYSAGSEAASGTWSPQILQMVGFTAGVSNSYAVGGFSNDNQATSDTSRRMAATAITVPTLNGLSTYYEAALSALDAGSFTLNWTTNTAEATVLAYVALGGDIQAEVLNWQTPTATGNKAVNIGTFQPDLVFHLSAITSAVPQSNAHMFVSLGAMNSSGEQWFLGTNSQDNVTANTARGQRTNACFGYVDVGTATFEVLASYVSMDPAGFTTNFSAVDASAYQVASLCIKGVKSKLGAYTKSIGAAPVTQQITAPNFPPAVVMQASYAGAAQATAATQAMFGFGATDGTNERAVGLIDVDTANPTRADSVWYSDKALVVSSDTDGTPSTLAVCDVTLTALGFDPTWTTNNGVDAEIVYAAIAAAD